MRYNKADPQAGSRIRFRLGVQLSLYLTLKYRQEKYRSKNELSPNLHEDGKETVALRP